MSRFRLPSISWGLAHLHPVKPRMSIAGGQCRGFCSRALAGSRSRCCPRDSGSNRSCSSRRLGAAGHQRCFNQMPCTAAINPPYPPSRAWSHTLRILLIARARARKLSCRRFTAATASPRPRAYVTAWTRARSRAVIGLLATQKHYLCEYSSAHSPARVIEDLFAPYSPCKKSLQKYASSLDSNYKILPFFMGKRMWDTYITHIFLQLIYFVSYYIWLLDFHFSAPQWNFAYFSQTLHHSAYLKYTYVKI